MILALDEGAWHPSGIYLLLALLSVAVSVLPLSRLARGAGGTVVDYAVVFLPFVAAGFFIVYFELGNARWGSIEGTSVDRAAILLTALPYAAFFAPNLMLLGLVQWNWLRERHRVLFRLAFAAGVVVQLVLACMFVLVWFER